MTHFWVKNKYPTINHDSDRTIVTDMPNYDEIPCLFIPMEPIESKFKKTFQIRTVVPN